MGGGLDLVLIIYGLYLWVGSGYLAIHITRT